MHSQTVDRTAGHRYGPTALARQARAELPEAAVRRGLATRARPRIPAGRRPPSGQVASGPVVGCACRAEPGQYSGYRMGRWARLTMTGTVLATAVVIAVSALAGTSAGTRFVTVAPGDSLWAIATATAPDRDPREVITEIVSLNGLSGDALPIGAVLRVPAG